MELAAKLHRIAEAAVSYAGPEEALTGIVPAEPATGMRLYLCAYRRENGGNAWLVLDGAGRPVEERSKVRDAVSISALCELAEEAAGGGDLDDLRARLVALRLTEDPPGIDDAEAAIDGLEAALGSPPQVASPQRLDAVGQATRRLEQALGDTPDSPFVEAMKAASPTIDALTRDVEASYKIRLG
jgi:hypothetical protein